MRLVLVAVGMLLLGGCNMVVTKTPLFHKADEAGAPRLRHGVWSETPSSPCPFDEKAPLASWPGCSQGYVLGAGTMSSYIQQSGKRVRTVAPIVLTGGDPPILQLSIDQSFGILATSGYVYVALHPTKTDAQGRVIAYESWPALCGPPPPPTAPTPSGGGPSPPTNQTAGGGGPPAPPSNQTAGGQQMRAGTLQPLPGLTMDEAGNNCSTSSKEAVRNSARLSRQWATSVNTDHWVRDGDQ